MGYGGRSRDLGYSDPFRSSVSDVLDYGPNLISTPETVMALAEYGAKQQEVQAMAGLYEAQKLAVQLDALPDEARLTTYNALSSQQKSLLRLARYEAPVAPEQKQGWFGRTFGNVPYVSDAAENVLGTVGAGIAAPLKPVLGAFNALENAKDRAFRTAYRVNEFGITTEDEGEWWEIGTWSRAWREVEDGEATFDLVEYDAIQRRYDPQTFTAAYNLAKGESGEEVLRFLMARGIDPTRAFALVTSEDTAKAVAELDTAKVSIGRLVGDLVGDPEVSVFGKKIHLTSGLVDGLDAVVLDPTLVGSKARSAIRMSRFGVRGADIGRIDTLMRSEQAARGWNRVGGQLETLRTADNAADKARAFDRLASEGLVPRNLIQPMLDAGVRDVDTAREWMVNARNAVDIVSGGRAKQLLPGRLTQTGELLLNLKGAAREKVDWVLDGPRLVELALDSPTYDAAEAAAARGEQLRRRVGGKRAAPLTPQTRAARLGLAVRRASTKVPTREKLRLSHPEAAFEIHAAAQMTGMPKYWADQVAATYLTAPHGARRQIEKGMLQTVLEHAANGSDSLRAWAAGLIDDMDDLASNRAYGLNGRDRKIVNGLSRSLAVTDGQLTDVVVMPSFTDTYAHTARFGVMDRLGAATHRDMLEGFMSRVFRPGVLLRPALAVRNFGEEVLSHVVRNGSRDYLQARAALSATTTTEGRLFRTLTSNFSPEQVDELLNAPTAANMTRMALKDRLKYVYHENPVAKGKRATASVLDGDEMAGYLDELANNNAVQASLARTAVMNAERGGMGYVQQEREVLRKVKRGGKMVVVSLTETGTYRQRGTEGLEGAARLHRQLVDISESKITRAALDLWDDPQAPERLAEFILSDDFRLAREMSERMVVDVPAGVSRAAAERSAALDWANTAIGHVRDHVSDADGNVVDELLAPLREGRLPSIDEIAALERKPAHAVSRDMLLIASPDNIVSTIAQRGFDWIGDAVDWASRQPIFLANYAEARRAQRGIESALIEQLGEKRAKALLEARAADAAITDTLAYVDNPDVRSQASVIMRNIVPFWRAQEEFYTRWAKTLVHSPDAIRKAQLLMHGMRHSGFVQRDNQGNDYFVYPAPGFVREAIGRVFGAPDLAVNYQFRGQVSYLNSGLDPRGVIPQVGPLVSIPLNALASTSPETSEFVTAIVGEVGVGRGVLDSITPTMVRRALEIVKDDGQQLASAKLQFIQAAAAEDPDGSRGLYLPSDASAADRQAFMQRAERWARSIVAMRFVYGLAAPAAPQAGDPAPESALADVQIDGIRSISDEFRTILNSGVPFEEAISAFIARHPDGSPWTVSKTESEVTGYLPATEQAGKWLKDNRDLSNTYKRLVPFLIDADPGEFDPNAFRLELAYGLRARKDAKEFYEDIALSGVIGAYYDAREAKDKMLQEAYESGSTERATHVKQEWSRWVAQYRMTNPLFADYQAQSATRVRERENILIDWKNAAVEGALPNTPSALAITAMVNARDAYTASLQRVLGRRDDVASRYRSVVDAQYLDYQRRIAATDPAAKAFYDRVIAPLDDDSDRVTAPAQTASASRWAG